MNKNPFIRWGFLISMILIGLANCATAEDGDYVRIGLATNLEEVRLDAGEASRLLDLNDSERRVFPWPGDQALITVNMDYIYINELPVGKGPLLVIPTDSHLIWNEKSYRGEFLIINKNGRLNLINRLPLEDYLRGVVPKEILAGWPMAALKAQAIAARTYTLANLERHRNDEFQLCATTHCQVYEGLTGEHPNTDQAVSETEGMIITYQDKLISAVYHDSSGGYTKDASEIWNFSIPYLKPVPGWDSNSPYNQWTRSFSWEELQTLIFNVYPELGRLRQIAPAAFGSDGRIIKITLKGENCESVITGEQFRHATELHSSNIEIGIAYGPEPITTLWWLRGQTYPEVITTEPVIADIAVAEVEPTYDCLLRDKIPVRLEIRGAGRGHGVGLSQWGAKGMAEAGYNERQILEHFYPGAILTPMVSGQEIAGETVTNVSK